MPDPVLTGLGALTLAIWVYLLGFRGGFWRADQRLPASTAERPDAPDAWPDVVALVPARNEAAVIGRALTSLLAQEYPGRLQVILIDDHSEDGTAEIARRAAAEAGRGADLTVLEAPPLPPGWAGKLWALENGLAEARRRAPEADYVWLSDADIVQGPDVLRRLVAKAEREGLDLVSVMAFLSSEGAWARLLIPPFVYFFQKLYPFAWSNDRRRRRAGSAGGCVLARAEALTGIGGFAAIRGEIIDDCALARRVKGRAREAGRGTWLGLSEDVVSIRPYTRLADVWAMVARSAYAQLEHSPLLLTGTLLGMVFTYLAPPLLVLGAPLHQEAAAALLGLAAWALMGVSGWPTYRLYRERPWRLLLLPLAAALYTAMTLDSAVQHWRGRGGMWKGRAQGGRRPDDAAAGDELEGGAASG